MKIALYPSNAKSAALFHIKPIAEFLSKRGATLYIDKEFQNILSLPSIEESNDIDIFIALGGDGTLLSCRQKYSLFPNALFTAVNLGSLGFMADIRIESAELYFEDLLKKNFSVEERIMLQTLSPKKETLHAVNDIVFHRGNISNMILLKVVINGFDFNTFQADGLVFSTPTGSTAYSLAAGGPILDTKLQAFVITPICVHGLTNRPFVIGPDATIEVTSLSSHGPIQVTVDGFKQFPLQQNETIILKKSPQTFKLISYHRHSLFETLRSKLHWRDSSVSNRTYKETAPFPEHLQKKD